MNEHDEDRIKKLLQQALPPVNNEPRDLWPAMLQRLDAKPAAQSSPRWVWFNAACSNAACFDGALLAALVGLAVLFPASIPVLLYCL